jgi:hypothetical protein
VALGVVEELLAGQVREAARGARRLRQVHLDLDLTEVGDDRHDLLAAARHVRLGLADLLTMPDGVGSGEAAGRARVDERLVVALTSARGRPTRWGWR